MGRHVQIAQEASSRTFQDMTLEQELQYLRAQQADFLKQRHQTDTSAVSRLRWIVGGSLFLVSYICANMALFFLQPTWWSLAVFYGLPLGILGGSWAKYRQKWG